MDKEKFFDDFYFLNDYDKSLIELSVSRLSSIKDYKVRNKLFRNLGRKVSYLQFERVAGNRTGTEEIWKQWEMESIKMRVKIVKAKGTRFKQLTDEPI